MQMYAIISGFSCFWELILQDHSSCFIPRSVPHERPSEPVHCIMAGTPSPQLYHYHIDPGENANVALQYPHKVGELSKLMDNQHAENES